MALVDDINAAVARLAGIRVPPVAGRRRDVQIIEWNGFGWNRSGARRAAIIVEANRAQLTQPPGTIIALGPNVLAVFTDHDTMVRLVRSLNPAP